MARQTHHFSTRARQTTQKQHGADRIGAEQRKKNAGRGPKLGLTSDIDDNRIIGVNTNIRDSIVVSISACHAEDPGSIPGSGDADTLGALGLWGSGALGL